MHHRCRSLRQTRESSHVSSGQRKIGTIATWVPASRQVLDDITELSGFISSSLQYYVNLEEELQLLAGSGTNEDLHGLLTQAQAFNTTLLTPAAGWTRLDLIGRAIQQITRSKEIPPSFVVLHPDDFWSIRLTKDGFGRYILGIRKFLSFDLKFSAWIWSLPPA